MVTCSELAGERCGGHLKEQLITPADRFTVIPAVKDACPPYMLSPPYHGHLSKDRRQAEEGVRRI